MEKEETQNGGDIGQGKPTPVPRPSFDSDQIDELRKRLYARGTGQVTKMVRHGVPPRVDTAPIPPVQKMEPIQVRQAPQVATPEPASGTIEDMGQRSKRGRVRKLAVIVGLVFFVGALLVASVLMFWGGNTISGENISITVSGTEVVGGGDVYEFQVAVANQNNVPIESSTLIVSYPKGTHSATGPDKELTTERHTLDSVGTGELVNVPLKVRMYGEESEKKEIKVWLEYRVRGSNATFEKYADPLHLTVTTSPVIVTLDAPQSMASGQEVSIDVVIQSNSDEPMTNLLVKAFYPEGFDFTSSDPDTLSGEDTWKVARLDARTKTVITVKGLLTAGEDDTPRFSATVGVPKEESPNNLASQLATGNVEIDIEQPSLEPRVSINGSRGESVVVQSDGDVRVDIEYANILSSAIEDGKVVVTLSGNAVADYRVETTASYDESAHTITWDYEEFSNLKEIVPGNSVDISFTLTPKNITRRTPEMRIEVTTEGKRESEGQSAQSLTGTTLRTIKVEGAPVLTAVTNFTEGPFTNTGPVPPVVGKVTQYTYLLTASAGVNDLTGIEVTAILPASVSWLDLVTSGDTVTFNSTTRTMKWTIGDLNVKEQAMVGVQVSFTPEANQTGKTPTILETVRLKATDRFTGTTVRSEAAALTTSLPNESGSGRVKAD
jgi:hypothetical protein